MGGSSTINGLIYMRGNREDYNDWASFGNPGWSYEEVLHYFKKSEDNLIPDVSTILRRRRRSAIVVRFIPRDESGPVSSDYGTIFSTCQVNKNIKNLNSLVYNYLKIFIIIKI